MNLSFQSKPINIYYFTTIILKMKTYLIKNKKLC